MSDKVCKQCNTPFKGPERKLFCSRKCFNDFRKEHTSIMKLEELRNKLEEVKLPESIIDFEKLTIEKIKLIYVETLSENSSLKDKVKLLTDKLASVHEMTDLNAPPKKFYGALSDLDIKRFVKPDQQPKRDIQFLRADGTVSVPDSIPKDKLEKSIHPVEAIVDVAG